MRVAPSINNQDVTKLATKATRDFFNVDTSTIFIDVKGNTSTIGITHLRYNNDFIPYSITATIKLIKASFTRSQVAIIAPYTAQVASYRHAMFRFIEWCLK